MLRYICIRAGQERAYCTADEGRTGWAARGATDACDRCRRMAGSGRKQAEQAGHHSGTLAHNKRHKRWCCGRQGDAAGACSAQPTRLPASAWRTAPPPRSAPSWGAAAPSRRPSCGAADAGAVACAGAPPARGAGGGGDAHPAIRGCATREAVAARVRPLPPMMPVQAA